MERSCSSAERQYWYNWEKGTFEYVRARAHAGMPTVIALAERLKAMEPAQAANEIDGMFMLCADEDLEIEISCDLMLDRGVSAAIATKLRERRGSKHTEPRSKGSVELTGRVDQENQDE
jgi:hypothetical protein